MELRIEFNLRLNALVLTGKCVLGQHDAQLILPSLLSLILILHVWVHVTIEELYAGSVGKFHSDTLVGRATHLD